jgi:hypothetical protein
MGARCGLRELSQASRVSPFKTVLVAVIGLAAVAVADATKPQLLVICSPGSPGTTEEAQPRMNAFGAALSSATGSTISVVYEPTDAGGVKRIEQTGLAIVSLPFFLEHEKDLGLHARLEVVQQGRPAHERWALVAQKGRVSGANALAGFTIVSNTGLAPRFVRGTVQAEIGALPANVKIVQSGAVVSSLRRAAAGEAIAVLVDGTQQASLATLPFAAKLEVVARSPPVPVGLVVTVDSRISGESWSWIETALVDMSASRAGAAALAALRMDRFAQLDIDALAAAHKFYAGTP